MKNAVVLAVLIGASSCTMVNSTHLPSERRGQEVFVTAGDIPEPYESLGLIQASRTGVRLFGFVDPVGTDLNAGFKETLIPAVKQMNGDGVINVRFHMTQLTPLTQALLLFPLFFIPVPTGVVITGEVVKLRR